MALSASRRFETLAAAVIVAVAAATGVVLVFVEPRDQADKIRCRMSGAEVADPSQARWLRFGWSLGQRLTATIPPGRFASVCSLAPGQYAFVARQVSGYLPRPDAALGTKATITVQ